MRRKEGAFTIEQEAEALETGLDGDDDDDNDEHSSGHLVISPAFKSPTDP